MTANPSSGIGQWSAAKAWAIGGFVVASLDILDVIIYYGLTRGTAATRIFQSVARGWFGPETFNGGTRTAAIGLCTHFFIAYCVVGFCILLSRRISGLRTRPMVFGPIYGLGVFTFMNFVVLPLSKAGLVKWTAGPLINQLLIHMIGIGMASALFARAARLPDPRAEAVAATA